MEWALLEARAGQRAAARRLFERGGDLAVPHEPLLEAWADFEESAGCRCPPFPEAHVWQCRRHVGGALMAQRSRLFCSTCSQDKP